MAASVDRVARLALCAPPSAPRACVNDFPYDDTPTAARHAHIAFVSATFLIKRKAK